MRSSYQIQTIIMAKCFNCVFAKEIPRASVRDRPAFNRLRVRPQQITHNSFLRYLSKPVYFLQIIDLFDVGGKTSMNAEYLFIDYCSYSQIVKNLGERAPDIQRAVFFNAFIVETIDLSDQPRLMVTSQQRDPIFVSNFESQQQKKSFDAVSTSVDVIAQKDIVGIGGISAYFEQLEQVVELTMYVPADGDWRSNSDCVGLGFQDVFGAFAELLDGDLIDFLFVFYFLNYVLCSFSSTHNQISNLINI